MTPITPVNKDEEKPQEDEAQQPPLLPNKWAQIYGAASTRVTNAILTSVEKESRIGKRDEKGRIKERAYIVRGGRGRGGRGGRGGGDGGSEKEQYSIGNKRMELMNK